MKPETNISLPTQISEPQWWEGGHFPPLTLRAPEPLRRERMGAAQRASSAARRASVQDMKRQLLALVFVAVLSVASYYLLSRFVATAVIVKGRSMTPTLQDGDRFILNRWSYFRKAPQRGDLVVVKDPGHSDYAVKRIIAMPGETLHFKEGELLLNGKHLFEPYLAAGTQTFLPDFPEKLIMTGKDQYFVLGDNRANSEDSRFYGAVSRSQIVGSIEK